jgi:hypothetical protein
VNKGEAITNAIKTDLPRQDFFYTRKFICRIDPKNAFPKPAFGGFKVEKPEFGWKERKVEYMTRRQKEKEKEVVERLRIQRLVHSCFNLGPIL